MPLIYSPWKIEQTVFEPQQEAEYDRQMSISNGYISQEAFFEEYYPEPQNLGSWLRGIAHPIPPIATISIRLHEERFNLQDWNVREFYRCQDRQQPMIERRVIADSNSGQTLRIHVKRLLSPENPHLMDIRYEVRSLNYVGPISFLALMGDGTDQSDWYPLEAAVYPEIDRVYLQSRTSEAQVAVGMTFSIEKNGETLTTPPIRVEKRYISGYSITDNIRPGDIFVLHKRVAVTDTVNYPSPSLFADLDRFLAEPQDPAMI